jgi:tetratricopeptide (TPR) repeat protein
MSLNKKNINFNLIERYFSGDLSAAEKNALEKKAMDDPILYEAMEGFEENPQGLERFKKINSSSQKTTKFSFASRTISVLIVAVCAYLVSIYLYEPRQSTGIEETTPEPILELVEVDVIPDAIDTFIIVEEKEQIALSEIVKNKKIIEEDNPVKSADLEDELIVIDEHDESDINYELEEEYGEKGFTEYAPSVYIDELYVVDYRKLNRKRKEINYIKYEFSGLSAEFESEDSQSKTELIEKEVKIPYTEYLRVSMEYFSNRKFKKALNRYTTILEQYPSDLNALFYGGLCYYNMSKFEEAIAYFELGLSIEKSANFLAFRQEIKWYTAKSLIKLNRINKAKSILDEIIAEGLFYSKDAISLKKSI